MLQKRLTQGVQARVHRSDQELLIEIPGRFMNSAGKAEIGSECDRPPFPSASFFTRVRWWFRRITNAGSLSPQVIFLGFIGVSIALLILFPQVRTGLSFLLFIEFLALLYTSQSTFIYLNRQRNFFLIYKALFPIVPRTYDARLSKIEDVFLDTPDWVSPDNRIVARTAIQTTERKYSFGEGLNKAECAQLAQEILDWLSFQPPQ